MKRKTKYIPYDYESAYNQSLEDINEWFIGQLAKNRKKVIYALKEIRAGEQMELEIYPQFSTMDDVPATGRRIVKDNKAQKNLNDKNARKHVERLINTNFSDNDIWITLTYDNTHLPVDIESAIKNVQRYIRRINYKRKKKGLPNAKYIYVTEYNPGAKIRWHHHVIMDGLLDMDTVEQCWKQSSRNEVRRLRKDENGLTGIAKYITKDNVRSKSERRWNSSQGLKNPDVRIVHSKKTDGVYKPISKFVPGFTENKNNIPEVIAKWYPDMKYLDADIYYNSWNCMFYIHIKLTRRKKNDEERLYKYPK